METIRKFDYSYPFMYFRRQRRDFYYDSLPSITGMRFYERLRSYHWITARNAAFIGSVAPGDLTEFRLTDDVARSNSLATSAMFEAIMRSIVMPQVGDFGVAARRYTIGNNRRIFDATTGNSTFALDASQARFVDPDFDTGPTAGGSWEYINWISHAGFDVEKSNATLMTIARDTYLDGRNLYINFRTDMPKAVDRLLGSLLAGDWDSSAAYLLPGGTQPQIIDLNVDKPVRLGAPATVRLLYPNFGYQQQSGAMIWAQLFSSLGTDLALVNKLLIYTEIEGNVDVINIPKSEQRKFTDPRSGFTYVARYYGMDEIDGKAVHAGIASRMLAHANDLLALTYEVEKDAAGNPTEDAFGRYTPVLDEKGEPVVIGDATTVTAFSDYVGLLDASVQISDVIGRGPFH
jgi:hypothetical protein